MLIILFHSNLRYHRVNQSYRGKYSEYFWGLEAKVNIAWSSDMNARTLIEIV